MKRVLLLIPIVAVLSGCFGFRDPVGNEAKYITAEDGSRSISVKTASGYEAFAETPATVE